jgi:glycosyltransferase involved in cell wall biosynthesis
VYGVTCIHHFLVSSRLGAVARGALGLARWLQKRGGGVRVWLPGPGPAAQAAEAGGLGRAGYWLDLMHRGPVGRLLGLPRVLVGLCRLPGLAHVHSLPAYRALRPALQLAGIPTVVDMQCVPPAGEIAWAFREPPDMVMTSAHFLVSSIQNNWGELGRGVPIAVVPSSVSTDRFFPGERRAAKQAVGAPLDRPLLVVRADRGQGAEMALRTVALLRSRGVAVECWLAGEEDDHRRPAYPGILAEELGVADRVRVLGPRQVWPQLLRAADFSLVSSAREELPLTVLEAQASGVPVLAAATPGSAEAVSDGETGFLIPAANPAGYADRIASLLRDPCLYHRVAAQALRQVRHEYSWETHCKRMAHVYECLVD